MSTKKRVFISFDIDNDDDAKKMLAGQALLSDSPFDFKDNSVKYHLTGDWEQKVRRRMDNVDVVIVLCGTKTHTADGVAAELTIAKEKSKSFFSFWRPTQIRAVQSLPRLRPRIKFIDGLGLT